MSAATSMSPAMLETQGMSRHESQGSTSRRDDRSYAQPSRTQSTRSRPSAAAPSPARANSSSQTRPTSRRVEEILPQQDYETSNVAATKRRSADRPPSHSRTESTRSGHQRTSSRHYQPSDLTSSVTTNGGGPAPMVVPLEQKHSGRQGRSRTVIPAQTGHWLLGKTIGAGSMGKVKLARRAEGGEEVAVKIIPRGSTLEESQHQSEADRKRAEKSKEIRTAREAAIVTLLDHPYICGMRDVVRTSHHWYMLFEYVNGGQMLDYIISHGKLKEKQARKFSRQISSALDYCHRNSIVHRDLKIENILISKTGDIKIIDFGLSNLFAPRSHLRTFCGSLYFAAPELLQAKAYTGPEVDVWSFGIVLYVLVCGKVPFDDQSMQALHAKIKKGVVEYPNWLTAECKNLISRMLVTDPKQRATLQEIMNHPWMLKGFGSPPENHLPPREPLTLPLDQEVIAAMTGFDFGPPEDITKQLTDVIQSEDYQRAVRVAQREREMAQPKDVEKKRGFGFDFYKRRSSTNSRDTLTMPSVEGLQLGNDPVNAYHPLISVYYLVREKQERDRKMANPGATSLPRTPKEAPLAMKMPEIAPPKAAYTNPGAYEMPGEKPTGGRSRPRARTQGEDDVTESMKHLKVAGTSGDPSAPAVVEPASAPEPLKRESTAANLLRRFSTRRKPKEPADRQSDKYYPPAVTVRAPSENQSALRKSFSIRRAKRDESRDGGMRKLRSGSSQPDHRNLLSPPRSAGEASSSSKIGRSTSVNSAEFRRRHGRDASPRAYKKPQGPSESEQSLGSARDEVEQKSNLRSPSAAIRAKSLGHARRESIQARRARREEAREAGVPEETDQELAESEGISRDHLASADNVKPGYLKGLFSVSTTSTKPVSVIRADIVRVLRQLNLEYDEIRGGFHCKWSPSIDLKKVNDVPQNRDSLQSPGASHRRRISFGGLNFGGSNADRDRDDYREVERQPSKASRRQPAPADRSYSNSEASAESLPRDGRESRRAVGETSTHVQSDLGGSMILEFEIFVVKVLPLLSLHGVQFKRLAGNTWQYKNMAEQILKELRL